MSRPPRPRRRRRIQMSSGIDHFQSIVGDIKAHALEGGEVALVLTPKNKAWNKGNLKFKNKKKAKDYLNAFYPKFKGILK